MKNIKKVLTKSISKKNNKKTIATAAIDLGFLILLLALLVGYLYTLMPLANTLTNAQAILSPGITEAEIDANLEPIERATNIALATTIALVILLFASITLLKGTIWSVIASKKPTKMYFLKLLAINAIILPVAAIVWVVVSHLFTTMIMLSSYGRVAYAEPTISIILTSLAFLIVYIIAITLLVIHPIIMAYAQLAETGKIGKTLKNMFVIGCGKIHHFLIPYLIIGMIFFLAILILGVIAGLLKAVPIISSIIIVLTLLILTAWSRIYIYETLKNVTK